MSSENNDDENVTLTNNNDSCVELINAKYLYPIVSFSRSAARSRIIIYIFQLKDSDDAAILADALLPQMRDIRSGLNPYALMHLDPMDIKEIVSHPDVAEDTLSDLAKFTRRACRQLVACTKEKVQSRHKLVLLSLFQISYNRTKMPLQWNTFSVVWLVI